MVVQYKTSTLIFKDKNQNSLSVENHPETSLNTCYPYKIGQTVNPRRNIQVPNPRTCKAKATIEFITAMTILSHKPKWTKNSSHQHNASHRSKLQLQILQYTWTNLTHQGTHTVFSQPSIRHRNYTSPSTEKLN